MNDEKETPTQQVADVDCQPRWSGAAVSFFQAAAEADSFKERAESLINGAQMLINIGQTVAARHILGAVVRAAEALDDEGKILYRAYYHYGWALSDLGMYEEARDYLNRASQSQEMEWPVKHHLAKVDLEVGMLEENEALVKKAFDGFAEHNEHFGSNLAHGLRLMARSKAAYYVLSGNKGAKSEAEELYQKTRERFEQEGNVYWPSELVEEEKMLLEEKDMVGLLGFQAHLRDKREKMHEDFKDIDYKERRECMDELVKGFRSLS